MSQLEHVEGKGRIKIWEGGYNGIVRDVAVQFEEVRLAPEDEKKCTDYFFLRTLVQETDGSPRVNRSAITFSGGNTTRK